MNSLVSIITPSYKSENFISETIESVIKQIYKDWEMIIVDDVSPDDANKVIENYSKKDTRIKLIKLEKNSGPAIARNRAIKESKGRYIAFLDADDLWEINKLEMQIKFMQEKDCALSYTYYKAMTEDGKVLDKILTSPYKLSYNDLLKTNHIGCLTAVYDTEKVGKIYMPLIKKRQDYGLWLNILKKTDFAYCLEEPLARYRLMSDSVSSNKFKLLKYNYLLFKDHEGFSSLKSLYYLFWNIFYKLVKK